MPQSSPLVSIGLPVYNGEAFIREALDSILSQTYQNIEVIITDNASDDNTATIVNEYKLADSRIKYYPSEVNKGAAWNYNRAFHHASGVYFKWAAHDDVLHPEYIKSCVDVLESDSRIALCQCRTGQIDEVGTVQAHEYVSESDVLDNSLSTSEVYRVLITDRGSWTRIFGVIRSDILRNTPLIDSYIGSDLTLLGELTLRGRVVDTPDVLFWRREHSNTSTRGAYNARRKRLVWFKAGKAPIANLPEWRLNSELFRSVMRTRGIHKSTFQCLAAIVRRVWKKRRLVAEDIWFAGKDISIVVGSMLKAKMRVLFLRKTSVSS